MEPRLTAPASNPSAFQWLEDLALTGCKCKEARLDPRTCGPPFATGDGLSHFLLSCMVLTFHLFIFG